MNYIFPPKFKSIANKYCMVLVRDAGYPFGYLKKVRIGLHNHELSVVVFCQ